MQGELSDEELMLAYGRGLRIDAQSTFVCDRSLNSDRFRRLTGYQPPAWSTLVAAMAQHHRGTPAASSLHPQGTP